MDAPIMGVREWRVDSEGALVSTGWAHPWSDGAQIAVCKKPKVVFGPHGVPRYAEIPEPEHPAPESTCMCGLYAFYDLPTCQEHGDDVTQQLEGVRGVVSAWGRVIRAEYGFKAEYMKIEALIVKADTTTHWGTQISFTPAYEALAKRYGVPLIKSEEVSAFMGLSGGTVLAPEPLPGPTEEEIQKQRDAQLQAKINAMSVEREERLMDAMNRDLEKAAERTRSESDLPFVLAALLVLAIVGAAVMAITP